MKVRNIQSSTAIALALALGVLAAVLSVGADAASRSRPAAFETPIKDGLDPLGAVGSEAGARPSPAADGETTPLPAEAERIEGSFIVDLAPGLEPRTAAAQIARDYGGRVNFVYDAVLGGFEFRGPDDARERLATDPRVAGVDPNYEVHTADTLTHINQVNAPAAWSTAPGYTGTGIKIAVLDTGVRASHGVFAGGKVVEGYGGCVGESSANDSNGHGTASASQAGGSHGVAPGALIVPIKVFPGSGTSTDWGKVVCGINRAKTMGYQVINMSLAGSSGTSSLQTAVQQAAQTAVLVAAAGNSGGAVGYPARYSEVIAVSGFQGTSTLASWSNRGSAVDIAAPGASICSADIGQGTDCSSHMSPDRSRSGTSRAAPQVAGAAAILRGAGVATGEVAGALKRGGDCPGGTANTGSGNCPSGKWSGDSDGFTEPFLDVKRALDRALVSADPLPTGTFVSPTHNQTVSGTWTVAVDASDNDTADAALDVDVKIGDGAYQQAAYSAVSGRHQLAWNTTATPDGPVTLTARITEAGNGSTTVTRTAVIDNVDSPPTVSWVSPTNGATVSPSFSARVSASDDDEITSVELFVDGVSQGQMTLSSGQYTKSVGPLAEGTHTLRVDVDDGVNPTVQRSIGITVADELYEQRFDTPGSTGWTVSGSYQLWHISSSCGAARSSPNGVYYGRDATCTYSNGRSNHGYLYTPWITGLPGSYAMTVSSKRKVERCSGCSRDRTEIQVNYGDGKGWRRIYYRDARNASTGTWETLNFGLGSSTGKVRVRFRFYTGSTTSNSFFGWAIDDFVLGAS